MKLAPAVAVRVSHRKEDTAEARAAHLILRREISTSEKRLAVGGQKHGERPAAALPHHLHDFLIDVVDVGALLPIDLDVHVALVHERGDLGVFERFVGHHVAPVAGRVTDREQDGNVSPAGLLERLVAPLPPVHRVVGVLEQIGTCRVAQPIGHASIFSQAASRPFVGQSWPSWLLPCEL